ATIVIFVFSIFTNEFTKRFQNKKRMLRQLVLLTHLPMLLFVFFRANYQNLAPLWIFQIVFQLIFLVQFLTRPVIYPVITSMLKQNYGVGNFGKLYGYSITFNRIAIMLAAFTFGVLLDSDPFAFVWVYPILAGMGILAVFTLSSIPYTAPEVNFEKNFLAAIRISFSEMVRIIRENKAFRDYEIGFMIYGIAWMVTMALVTIFFERELKLNYTSVATYKNAFNILTIILLPFVSKLVDRYDPRKFAAFTFSAMMLHTVFMALTFWFPSYFYFGDIKVYHMLILSYIAFGAFQSAMTLAWNIGSAYFCPPAEVTHYQSVHLTMVGLRALFAPLIGVYLLSYMNYGFVFSLSAILLLAAMFFNLWSVRNTALSGAAIKKMPS
ncbi:MAG: hypothetical protein RIS47_1111, partial [Bacteroidota bacterium]